MSWVRIPPEQLFFHWKKSSGLLFCLAFVRSEIAAPNQHPAYAHQAIMCYYSLYYLECTSSIPPTCLYIQESYVCHHNCLTIYSFLTLECVESESYIPVSAYLGLEG